MERPDRALKVWMMVSRTQTATTNLLTQAKQGDLQAIAMLMNRALQSHEIRVQVALQETCLHLLLEAVQVPGPDEVVPFLQHGLTNLAIPSIRSLRIYGQQLGHDVPIWQREVPLGDAPVLRQPGERPLAMLAELNGTGRSLPASQREEPLETSNGLTAVVHRPALDLNSAHAPVKQQIISGDKQLDATQYGCLVQRIWNRDIVPKARPHPKPILYCRPVSDRLDRQLELEDAIATLHQKQSVHLMGEAGVGKTVLLRSLAHDPQLNVAFPGGVVYHSVRHQPVADLIQTLFDDFFEYDSETPTKPTEAEIQRAFQGQPALVVLDDLNLPAADLDRLYTLPGLTIVSAGGDRALRSEVNTIALAGLPIQDALQLMQQGLGRPLTPQEVPEATTLCELVNGNPQQILQATALLREGHYAFTALIQLIQAATFPHALTLKATAALSEAERQVLAVLLVLDGIPIHIEHLTVLLGIPNLQVRLTNLVQRHLIVSDGARYSLTQQMIVALRPIWELSQWQHRVLTYFSNWVEQRTALPGELLREGELLLHMVNLAFDMEQWERVLRLVTHLDACLLFSGQWGAWEQLWHRGWQAGRSLNHSAAVAWALHQLGTHAFCVDDPFTAHTYLVTALQLREVLGDEAAATVTRHNLDLLLTSATPIEPTSAPAALPASSDASRLPGRSYKQLLIFTLLGLSLLGGLGILFMWLLSLFPKPAPVALNFTRLGFGEQSLNVTSITKTAQLTNTSSEPVTIQRVTLTGTDVGDFQIGDRCTTVRLAPRQTCLIDVSFTPQALGNRQAIVTIQDETGHTQELLLNGIGKNPDTPFVLSFSPGNLTFPKQTVGNSSDPRTITVINSGSVAVPIGQITLTGEQMADFKTTSTCPNITLDPKDACTIQVQFAPRKVGDSRATLVITGKRNRPGVDATRPLPFWNIPLNGTSAAPPQPPAPQSPQPSPALPQAILSTGELTFGRLELGASQEKSVVVSNQGTAALQIRSIKIVDDPAQAFTLVRQTCGDAIAPDRNCSITLRFTAKAVGDRTATLAIADNTTNSPHTVLLKGSVLQPSPDAPVNTAPSILRFVASPAEIDAGASTNLCYGVVNATRASITGIGDVKLAAESCVAAQPAQTTTYTLTAIGADGKQVTAEITVQVNQPDLGPPTTPENLTPGDPDAGQAPDLLSCKASTLLRWQPGTSGSHPVAYILTVQSQSANQEWVTVLNERVTPPINISPQLMQHRTYRWRWNVAAVDAQGRQSDTTRWQYFTCFDFH